KKEALAFIGIGSNLGDRLALCREAVGRLQENPAIKIIKVSSLYETEPMEFLEQEWFYNAVVQIQTTAAPDQLLNDCQSIENRLRKKVEFPKGPRTIDLDLLFYDQEVVNRPGLTLPHPAAAERPFVLIPLAEIAPDFIHPLLHESAQSLLRRLKTSSRVEKKFAPGWESV
ncbi:MAG TPA: 2-amino-4-hydroxy-6-hydroxymethyldihydropteridine diphosphokinase, partial [Candidatus Manganitrophaceae bacterium]